MSKNIGYKILFKIFMDLLEAIHYENGAKRISYLLSSAMLGTVDND